MQKWTLKDSMIKPQTNFSGWSVPVLVLSYQVGFMTYIATSHQGERKMFFGFLIWRAIRSLMLSYIDIIHNCIRIEGFLNIRLGYWLGCHTLGCRGRTVPMSDEALNSSRDRAHFSSSLNFQGFMWVKSPTILCAHTEMRGYCAVWALECTVLPGCH